MESIIGILILIIVAQMFLSIYQIKYYDNFIKHLAQKYNYDGYNLNSDTKKSLFKTIIVILVTDNEDTIVEAYRYEGFTVFAKFKAIDEVIGIALGEELFNGSNDHLKTEYELINNIRERIN